MGHGPTVLVAVSVVLVEQVHTEKPTPSLASTIRLLRQLGVLMSRSVSSGSATVLTITEVVSFLGAHGVHGIGQQVESLRQLVVGDGERRHGLRDAGLTPRNVPLCSPGSQTSSSGLSSVTASGSPKAPIDFDRHTMSGVMPADSTLKNGR